MVVVFLGELDLAFGFGHVVRVRSGLGLGWIRALACGVALSRAVDLGARVEVEDAEWAASRGSACLLARSWSTLSLTERANASLSELICKFGGCEWSLSKRHFNHAPRWGAL